MARYKKQKIKKTANDVVATPRKIDRKICPICGSVEVDFLAYKDEYIDDSVTIFGECLDCGSTWDLVLDLDDGMVTNLAPGDDNTYSYHPPVTTRRKASEFAFIPDSTPLYYETRVVDDTNTKGDKTDE